MVGVLKAFNIDLKREGGEEKQVITTRDIRIWSPIQVLTPPNRA